MRYLIPDFILQQHAAGETHGSFCATTLFADIAGYTPLTETLMQHQKDGAETLSDALYAIFGALVESVYHHGGLIALFSGDAITAIFPFMDGDDEKAAHDAAARATLAAFTIQDYFQPHGEDRQIETPYGAFGVACKVGLSIGEVKWGIVDGGGARSFYFRGDGVRGCAHAEMHAARAQIVADDKLLRWLNPYVTGVEVTPGYHRLHRHNLSPHPGAHAAPAPTRTALAPFVHPAVLDMPLNAEFREVTAIFLLFKEPEGEADLHAIAGQLLMLTQRYGGTLLQLEFGDKGSLAIVLFGAPVAHEQNAVRAAQFLLATRATLAIPIRGGLTAGMVWAGFRGGEGRHEYSAVGDVMNLSARLAVKAPWGEIWCSHAAATQLRPRFTFVSLGVLTLKGKTLPQAAFQLRREADVNQSSPRNTGDSLVGRADELVQLTAFLAPLNDSRFGGAMVVVGEAGIGKSRLVNEVRQATAATHIWLDCPADRILRRPFGPFRHALRLHFDLRADDHGAERSAQFNARFDALLAALPDDEDAAAIARELTRTRSFLAALVDIRTPGSRYEQLNPELRYENTLAAYRAFVLALALQSSLVLFVDDVQWLDPDSAQLLQTLTTDVQGRALAVVATARYDDHGVIPALDLPSGVTVQTIELRGLGVDGVQRCVVQALAAEVDAGVAEFVAKRTNGNPFYIEQLAVDLHERGLLTPAKPIDEEIEVPRLTLDESGALDAVPASLSAVLVARLDRLAPRVKAVVQTAAVLGREFETPVLARMLPDDNDRLAGDIKAAQRRQIWASTQDQVYTFRHVLLRDAAYDMQLRARLRRLHHQAAEAIEIVYSDALAPCYGELTHHYGLARDQDQERNYAGLAGKHAAGEYANQDAIRYLGRALELTATDRIVARHDLHMVLGGVYALIGDHEDARQQYVGGLAETPTGNDAFDALNAQSYLGMGKLYIDRDPAEAQRWVEQGLTASQSAHAPEIEAECYIAAGTTHLRTGDWADAKQNLALARQTAPDNAHIQSEALLNLVGAHVFLAEMDDAIAVARAALTACRELENPLLIQKALNNLASVEWWNGHWDSAVQGWTEAKVLADELGDAAEATMIELNLGLIGLWRGQAAQEASLRDCLSVAQAHDLASVEIEARIFLGMLNIFVSRDYDAAIELLAQTAAQADAIHDLCYLAQARSYQALAYLALGQFDAAEETVVEAIAVARSADDSNSEGVALRVYGELRSLRGEVEAGRALLEESRAVLEPTCNVFELAMTEAKLGVLRNRAGTTRIGNEHWQRAVQTLRQLGATAALAEVERFGKAMALSQKIGETEA